MAGHSKQFQGGKVGTTGTCLLTPHLCPRLQSPSQYLPYNVAEIDMGKNILWRMGRSRSYSSTDLSDTTFYEELSEILS